MLFGELDALSARGVDVSRLLISANAHVITDYHRTLDKVTERFLDKGWIFYLYHPQNLATHTARLEGFRPVPDGLLRVVGLKLK